MKKSFIIALTVACSLIVIGGVMIGLFFGLGGRFEGTEQFKEVTHRAEGAITRLDLSLSDADLTICPSPDGSTYAVCDESDKRGYTLSIEGETLVLREDDRRAWYDHIGIQIGTRKVVLYIPAGTYAKLTVKTASGELDCASKTLVFEEVTLSASSGTVKWSATVLTSLEIVTASGDVAVSGLAPITEISSIQNGMPQGALRIKTSSGDVMLKDCKLQGADLETSSGAVIMTDVRVPGGMMRVTTSSGDVELTRCDALEIDITTSSGDVEGVLLSDKAFKVTTSSGTIECPETNPNGWPCRIKTSSGDIKITVEYAPSYDK